MDFLNLPRIEPSPESRAIVASLYPRASGLSGCIGYADAMMLLTLIQRGDARQVVEIGVASGASTLYILGMLNALRGPRQLFAFDNQPRYYADESRLTGFLALESEFNVDDRLTLAAEASSLDLRSTIASRARDAAAPVDVGFIDANHRHPWPTIDFLMLLPLMREGGAIVLHDINLPSLLGIAGSRGASRLFGRPFRERFVVGGDRPNLGAIRVDALPEMIEQALAALSEPWELELGPAFARRFMREARAGALAERAGELARFFLASA